jgi:very-short-patch-repair endonuclease
MRREPTHAERILWRHLSRSQLGGHKFRRQAVMEPYIADFFCPAKGLIVEVDGDTHTPARDHRRDTLLADRGFTTMRFTNGAVQTNLDGVLTALLARLGELPDRWPGTSSVPTPCPSPEGEGEIC